MLVSYKSSDGNYGYMCFTDGYVKVDKLHEYIEDRLFRKVAIQFIALYSNKKEHYVQTYTDGVYRNILWKYSLGDIEKIGDLYLYLHRKYGFTNILGYT